MTPTLQAHEPVLRVERIGLVLGLVTATVLMWPLRHNVTDDAFIHLQYAKHLAQGRGPVFNNGEHVYGCTSPLWAAMLADAMAVGWNGLIFGRILGFIATLATIPMFLQLMRRGVRLPALRGFATLAWSANPWMLQWSTAGMETPLAVALTLAGFVAFTEGRSWGSRPVRTGALWALAALTRPEAVFLLALWAITLLVDTNNRTGLRRMLFGLVPPALIYGAWLLFARFFFGTFWPRSIAIHRVVPQGFEPGRFGEQLRIVMQTDGVLLVVMAAAFVFGGRALWERRPRTAQHALPWLFVLGMPLLYVARGIPPRSRYLVVLLPVLAWLAWRSADAWWLGSETESKARRTQATVFGFAVMALSLLLDLGVYRTMVLPGVQQSTAALHGSLMQWGSWFGRHAPADAVIASREVGALGFLSDRRVLDTTSLISPEMEPVLAASADPVARLAFPPGSRPTYIVDRASRAFDLTARSPYRAALTPLGHATAYVTGARVDSVYTFYRVNWGVFDTLHIAPPEPFPAR